MNVFPQDLGRRWHVALVAARTPRPRGQGLGPLFTPNAAAPPRRDDKTPGPLARFWSGGTNLGAEAASDGLAGMAVRTRPLIGLGIGTLLYAGMAGVLAATGQPETAVIITGASAFMGSLCLLMPRWLFGRVHNTALVSREIETLLPTARDDLDRAFLTLVGDVVRQSPSAMPLAAQTEVRSALSALGEAIEQMPALAGANDLPDVGALRNEAACVRAEAEREPDAVAQASLVRQADALVRRADALFRAATLTRRTQVLRRELIAQTEALRAGLAGFSTNGGGDVSGLAGLAETVRGVALEASSVADARAELDASDAPAVVTVGARA